MTAPDQPVDRVEVPAILRRGAPAAVLAALPGARAVGGAVRDALAGLDLHDVDVAAPFPPEAIAARLRDAGLKVFDTGLSHGTVTAVLDHEPVEVTALRRDVVTDGRHAEVEWTTDWREDAARRDFTINALSLAPDGSLFDYFGGRADLAAGVVRFVGDPATRLREDYLRVLRFFRFQTRYGLGAPDAAAVAAIRDAVPGLARLSVERVWMELKRILGAPDPTAAAGLMAETGVLPALLPEAKAAPLAALVALGAPADPLLRFAALHAGTFAGEGWRELRRQAKHLRMSAAETDALCAMAGPAVPPLMPAVLSVMPAMTGDDIAPALFAMSRILPAEACPAALVRRAWLGQLIGDAPDASAAEWDTLRARIAESPVPVFPLQGRDAMAEGVPAGPQIGQLLRSVEGWWLLRGCRDDAAACLAELRRLVAANKKNGGAGPGGEARG